MTDKKETKEQNEQNVTADAVAVSNSETKTFEKKDRKEFKKNRRESRRGSKGRSEFDQKILDIRRVTRVAAGGRRFSFSVALVVGNRKGRVGVGTGKAGDTSFAIQKALKDAEKRSIQIKMTKNNSIPHQVEAKYNSARVLVMPAKGRGIIAGSALRDILELGGLRDINSKIFSGSKNKLNIARATIKALSEFNNTVKDDDKNLKPKEAPKKRFNPQSRDRRGAKKR